MAGSDNPEREPGLFDDAFYEQGVYQPHRVRAVRNTVPGLAVLIGADLLKDHIPEEVTIAAALVGGGMLLVAGVKFLREDMRFNP